MPEQPIPIPLDDERVVRARRELQRVKRAWLRIDEVEAVDVGIPYRKGRPVLDQVAVRVHVEHKLPVVPDERRFGRGAGRRLTDQDVRLDVLEASYRATGAGSDAERSDAEQSAPAVDPRQRVAPLVGGVSIGNPRVSAGTLGAIVFDVVDGRPCVLSNWHVLAGSVPPAAGGHTGTEPHYHSAGSAGAEPHYHSVGPEPHHHGAGPEPHYHGAGPEPHYHGAGPEPHYHSAGLEPHYHGAGYEPHYHGAGHEPHYHGAGYEPHYHSASSGAPHLQAAGLGEPIYQPGRFDGGTAADTVAVLGRHRLDRHVDAAIAPLVGARPYWPSILGLGRVEGTTEPMLGMVVTKSGRSTGVTRGVVDGVDLATTIDFPHGEHRFEGQLRIAPYEVVLGGERESDPEPDERDETSEPGDSGALWIEEASNAVVGLHFGGDLLGTADSEHSLANPIGYVVEALGIAFEPVVRPITPIPGPALPARPAWRDGGHRPGRAGHGSAGCGCGGPGCGGGRSRRGRSCCCGGCCGGCCGC